MKKMSLILAIGLCLALVMPLLAVEVTEDNTHVMIKTKGYDAYWKKAAQMGYVQVFVGGSKETIVGTAGRAFYHSGEYDGWKDWGALKAWKVVEKTATKAVVNYTSNDGGAKDYDVTCTYYDTVPYIKHVVKITNAKDAAIPSFKSGHSPMFEVNVDIAGMKVFAQPFPYGSYWTKSGFYGAIYGPDAKDASLGEWAPRNPGRMQLNHDNQSKDIKKGESTTITYYVAFGKGGENDATALAAHVKEEPPTSAVSSVGALTTTWGDIRSRQ